MDMKLGQTEVWNNYLDDTPSLIIVKNSNLHFLHKIEIDVVNPRIEQTLGKMMVAGNSNIINCSVHHYYCRESSLEPNSSVLYRAFLINSYWV